MLDSPLIEIGRPAVRIVGLTGSIGIWNFWMTRCWHSRTRSRTGQSPLSARYFGCASSTCSCSQSWAIELDPGACDITLLPSFWALSGPQPFQRGMSVDLILDLRSCHELYKASSLTDPPDTYRD